MKRLMTIFTFKRRSIVAAISAGVLSLGFAACQSTTEAPVVQGETATKTTTETISSAPDVGEQSQRRGERGDRARGDGTCLLYTSPSPRDKRQSRMPSSA